MLDPQPVHCRPQAYTLLAEQLPVLDTTRGLVLAATAVSMHEVEDADPVAVEASIAALADDIAGRVRRPDTQAVLAHAHQVLFEEVGFVGNTGDYYNPANSYLPFVLKNRQGLPITLSLVYKAVLDRLGVRVVGVNAPGHFMAAVIDPDAGGALMLVDPFHGGRVLSREEAFARLDELAGRRVPRDDNLLQPATHTQWLLRIIHNLILVFDRLNRRDSLDAMLEMQELVGRAAP